MFLYWMVLKYEAIAFFVMKFICLYVIVYRHFVVRQFGDDLFGGVEFCDFVEFLVV